MEQRANFLALCLLDALEDEEEKVVYHILDNYKVDPSFVQLERGIAPLHYACGMPNRRLAVEITRRFLECAGDVDVRTDENMTPLHVASIYGRVEIVEMLLLHGAKLDVVDDERKTPVLYAIEEYHFDVVQLMRDHIFECKFRNKQKASQNHTQSHDGVASVQSSTSNRSCVNKNLQAANVADQSKYTPNKIHYNYDVTSPYYINITHRRNRQQPVYPAQESIFEQNKSQPEDETGQNDEDGKLASPVSPEKSSESVNIFTLTKKNLEELSRRGSLEESSRISQIEVWREKVQRSRERASILREYNDVNEMIDSMMQSDHLDFTNTVLRSDKENLHYAQIYSDTCGSDAAKSSPNEDTQYALLPPRLYPKVVPAHVNRNGNISLDKLIESVAKANIANPEQSEHESDTSFQTVPEIVGDVEKLANNRLSVPGAGDCSDLIRSPKAGEYILQMTEAYVHTDAESGLVFYEKKLVRNRGNKMARQRMQAERNHDVETSFTSQSTNLTLPVDYETDALRAELTNFGNPPGPITKSTKRMYIKRLVKYKRKNTAAMDLQKKNDINEMKFSVELYRTVRSPQLFEQIPNLLKYEAESSKFFANNKQNKEMREGHLKQSFIYLLIDPRISSNLPGEYEFLDKYKVWQRFLQSIFYVGKGKTSRPYSHLYDAMKRHSRLQREKPSDSTAPDAKMLPCSEKEAPQARAHQCAESCLLGQQEARPHFRHLGDWIWRCLLACVS